MAIQFPGGAPSDDVEWSERWRRWLGDLGEWARENVGIQDFALEVGRGNVTGVSQINKFGRNVEIDSATAADIWDGGKATSGVSLIWVAPTAARTHQIVSSSASDASAGVGARTVQVYGLTSWTAVEVSETITMNGTTDVPTTNDYVIIHRIKVLTKGATNVNVGTITATADTDSTITAQIEASAGQTQMAIYGIPSIQDFYMTSFYNGADANASSNFVAEIQVNPEPNTELTNFVTKHVISGSVDMQHFYEPYKKIAGPAIIKIQVSGTANNTDVQGGFDGYLVNT